MITYFQVQLRTIFFFSPKLFDLEIKQRSRLFRGGWFSGFHKEEEKIGRDDGEKVESIATRVREKSVEAVAAIGGS